MVGFLPSPLALGYQHRVSLRSHSSPECPSSAPAQQLPGIHIAKSPHNEVTYVYFLRYSLIPRSADLNPHDLQRVRPTVPDPE